MVKTFIVYTQKSSNRIWNAKKCGLTFRYIFGYEKEILLEIFFHEIVDFPKTLGYI